MPEFYNYVDVEVDEFWDECSTSEKEALVNRMVDDGWVKRTSHIAGQQLSMMDIEWVEMCNNLSDLRLSISPDDEEIIKQIVNKYV
jgi:hypothetical protein